MFCEKCGKKINKDDRFCESCGSPIEKKKKTPFYKNKWLWIYIIVSVLGWTLFGDDSETHSKKPESSNTEDYIGENQVLDIEKEPEETQIENDNFDKEDTEIENKKSLEWKKAYYDYLVQYGNSEYEYGLEYIDGDDIPELTIDHIVSADGTEVCTYDGTKVVATYVGQSMKYRLKENIFCVSGGRMDHYYDYVYKIIDGIPQMISKGEYGILDEENIQYDEYGAMIFQYSWNGELISKYDYYANLEKFNYENYSDIVCPAGKRYLYDIMEILAHPLDITLMDPYINSNGYENLLSNYVILFDGIESDKIHFVVKYNDEIVGSASAKIIDANTAEFKNTKSDIIIRFDVDYAILEVEGYMDTFDLTGKYMGRWG